MNSLGPLAATFVFFAIMFVIGKTLQRSENEKRKRLERQIRDVETYETEIAEKIRKAEQGGQGQAFGLGGVTGEKSNPHSAASYSSSGR
jgi:hypothetical protein